MQRSQKRLFISLMIVALYLISVIPVGMGLYAIKNWLGYNVSAIGGFHSLQKCMASEWDLYRQSN